MEKRTLILGSYNTAGYGWTLAACKISKAQQMQTFIHVPGRHAPLDLSTALTDGQPYYDTAGLEATLECSIGDRPERQRLLHTLVNYLDGKSLPIVHPDHPGHYLMGRIQAFPLYSDLAHCALQISAICDPWLYASQETGVSLIAEDVEKTALLALTGRMAVTPTITVDGEINLVYGSNSWALSTGEHILPDLHLTPGEYPGEPGLHEITYSGTGTVSIKWREAVLAA